MQKTIDESTVREVAEELNLLVVRLSPHNTTAVDVDLVANVCDNIVLSNVKKETAKKVRNARVH